MQLGFYFDQTRCTGCDTCTIACKDWNELPLDSEPANWRWVTELESGKFPNPSVAWLAMSCLHCANAPCVEACPAGAIHKRAEDGIVYIDRNECMGSDDCGAMCYEVCPYGAPKFGPEPDPRMQKCDFCIERWGQGKLPVCVTACPMRALDAGDMETLRAKYGDAAIAIGFEYSPDSVPSIIMNSA